MDPVKDLCSALGPVISDAVLDSNTSKLIEVILDLGRPLQLRFIDRSVEEYEDIIITEGDLKYVCGRLTAFGPDNRAGLNRSLHRISRIVAKDGVGTIGLTCRVGRAIEGTQKLIEDFLDQGKSVLLIGRPGAGKTSLLRASSKYLSSELHKNVVIVDTSDEIAGSGNVPHPAVGRSRKLPVPYGRRQDQVLLEAVENHLPDSIVVDEVSDMSEVDSVNTIAKRGVQILATCHGNTIQDVIENKVLRGLLGGVKDMPIGDDLAKAYGGRKTRLERTYTSAFDVVVELRDFDYINVYTDINLTVDSMLEGRKVVPEDRRIMNGVVRVITPFYVELPKGRVDLSAILEEPSRNGRRKSNYQK